jgi:hypothetical protein
MDPMQSSNDTTLTPPLYGSLTDLNTAACLGSSAYFMSYMFGVTLGRHHGEWGGIADGRLVQQQDQLVPVSSLADNAIRIASRIMLMAPRNHGKTTFWSVAYPLQRIAKDQNIRIIIVSNTGTQARSFLRQITTNIERNEKYIDMFGQLKPQIPDKWTQDEIIVERTNMTLKDPTVSAVGTGGAILSKRADLIICDDILNKENTRTAYQRQQTKEWFDDVLLPVLEPDGQLIVVGTAWNTEDLYHKLMQNRQYDIRLRYDAIKDEDLQTTLWPARWTWDKLMALKDETGTLSFNKSYRNKVNSSEDAIWQQAWLDRAKANGRNRRLIKSLNYEQWDLGRMVIAGGIDLAISKRKESDSTAFAVIGLLDNGMKIPLYLEEAQGISMGQTENRIQVLHQRFRPSMWIVETNGYQAALQRDMADTTAIPIRGYTTGGEKFDEDVGLNSLAVEFENDKWILPYDNDDQHTMDIVDRLVEGMADFPNGHTPDILMALWFANTAMRALMANPKRGTIRTGRMNMMGR